MAEEADNTENKDNKEGTDNVSKDEAEAARLAAEASAKEETDEEGTEAPADDEKSELVDYPEYDQPALKQVVNVLKEAGISVKDAEAVFKDFSSDMDVSKIDRKALVEKVGEAKADLLLVLAGTYAKDHKEEVEAAKKLAFSITGDEATFDAMKAWANEKAGKDPEFAKELDELRSMISTGKPKSMKAAIRELFAAYKADPNKTIEADLTTGDGKSGASVQPLSRQEFIDLIEKAHKDGKYKQLQPSLWKRRQAGIKQGI